MIIPVDGPEQVILRQKTEDIGAEEFGYAQEIADQLYLALQPYFPSAGLAAPQIGISRSVFIFSYDRDPKNLEVVINPAIVPLGTIVMGWELCLSVLLSSSKWQAAHVPRCNKIKVIYFNLKGEKIESILEGFAAKAFQHEYDHLQGIVNIDRKDAEVKTFDSKEELQNYMKEVKKGDAAVYIKPVPVGES